MHNDFDDAGVIPEAAATSDSLSDAIVRSLANLRVFEFVNLFPGEVGAAKRIHAIMARCHGLENIWICGSSKSYWENPSTMNHNKQKK